jgi:hypothetical protein
MSVKRWTYLLLGVLLMFGLILFLNSAFKNSAYIKLYTMLGVVMLLGGWAWYGGKLSAPIEEEKRKKKAALLAAQSEWQGKELRVAYRWIAAPLMTCLLGGVFLLLSALAISLITSPVWKIKGILGFSLTVVLLVFLGCFISARLFALIAAIFSGFSIKVIATGLKFSGLPILPFKAIQRAGYREQTSRHGSSQYYLLIELDWDLARTYWPHAWRAMLAGYPFLAVTYLRRPSRVKLVQVYAGEWSTPAPTIAAAIRKISELSGGIPVAEYSEYASLEESREEARLWRLMTASGNILASNDKQLGSMYERFAKGERLTDKDTGELDEKFAKLDDQFKVQRSAIDQYMGLQTSKIQCFNVKVEKDLKHMPKLLAFFTVLAIIAASVKVFA